MAALRTWMLGSTAAVAWVWPALALEPRPVVTPSASTASTKPKVLLDYVAEPFREVVAGIIKAPTISAKANDDEFVAHPNVYDWLIEHPDRTTQAWKRLKVPCVDITDLGKGQFFWSDETGSELTWQTVGKFDHGVIWYATGKVKPGVLLPTVPVKAVAVLHSPRGSQDPDTGNATFKPTVQVYLLADSRVAAGLVKMMGPSAPKMAEEGAEQFLFFFSGIARYIYRKPDQLEILLAPAKK
jgi:hypothetical protein